MHLIDKKYLDKKYVENLCVGVIRFDLTDSNTSLLHLSKMMSAIIDENLNVVDTLIATYETDDPIFLKILGGIIKIKITTPSITDSDIRQKLYNAIENRIDRNTFNRVTEFIESAFNNIDNPEISNINLDIEFDKMFKYILTNKALKVLEELKTGFYEKDEVSNKYDSAISNIFKLYENSIVSKDITIDNNSETIVKALRSVENMNQEVRSIELFESIKFLEKKRIAIAVGVSGCLSGDTQIRIKRGNSISSKIYSIKDVYHRITHDHEMDSSIINWDKNIKNYTISYIGKDKLAYNEIDSIYYSGEKMTYILTTDKNNIRCTDEHPFLTPDYNFVELKDLKVNDKILGRNKKSFNKLSVETIVSIIPNKIEATYDISMKAPHANYVANNLVVHNTGKSMFLCHCIAEYLCKPKNNSKKNLLFYFTFENSREETFVRIMANILEMSIDDIKFKLSDDVDRKIVIEKYMSKIDKNTVLKIIELSPKKFSMTMVEAEIKREIVRHADAEVYAVALDYIDKMLPVDTSNKTKRFDQQLGDVVDDFKSLTRTFECAGLSVSQVNRVGAKKSKTNNESWDMTDIGGSWEKVENADIVLLMDVENLVDEMGYNIVHFRNQKHRYYIDNTVITTKMIPSFARYYKPPANMVEIKHVDHRTQEDQVVKKNIDKTDLFI